MIKRPNLSTSTKAVREYVEDLERNLGEVNEDLDRLINGITTEKHWAGRSTVYLDYVMDPKPIARERDLIYIVPNTDTEKERHPHFQIRWTDEEGGYLDVSSSSVYGTRLSIEPRAANNLRLRVERS